MRKLKVAIIGSGNITHNLRDWQRISLLGLRVGDMARWQTPHGEECVATIENIQYQPEATGDYHT